MNVFKETVPLQCLVHMSQDKFRKMLHTDQSKRLDELCHKSLPYIRSQREELGQKLLALRTACWFLALYTDATIKRLCNHVIMYLQIFRYVCQRKCYVLVRPLFSMTEVGQHDENLLFSGAVRNMSKESPWGPKFLSVCILGHARQVICWKGRQTYTTWSSGLLQRRRILSGSLEKVRNSLICSRDLMMSTMAPLQPCWRERETSSLSLRMVPALVQLISVRIQVIPQSSSFLDQFAILLNCQG